MAPRAPRPVGKEDILQAVVLADTFDNTFSEFSQQQPRCLLPLLGHPLIDYTLESLARSGIKEVFVFAAQHSDQLESYLNASKWKSTSTGFRRLTFLKSAGTSVGDVMRDLEQKTLMSGDFLVVSGDVISDFPIEDALKQHRARREKDKNAIMTLVLREGPPGRMPRTVSPTFVINPLHDRCLHYEESNDFRLSVDPEILTSNAELDVRQDLVDCRIDICTPDVLGLWSDNFDNQSPRKDFLYGILKDYELNGKTVHTYIVKHHYAVRVSDEHAYGSIARELRLGWCGTMSFDLDFSHQATSEESKYAQQTLSRTSSTSSLSTNASIPNTISPNHSRNPSTAAASIISVEDDDDDDDPDRHANNSFHTEAVSTLLHRLHDSADVSDIQVELMGLRFATNATESQVRRAVAVGITRSVLSMNEKEGSGTGSVAEITKRTVGKYKKLIQRDTTTSNPSEATENQIDFLVQAQASLAHKQVHDGKEGVAGKVLLFLCKELYDQEVFGEEVFLGWWENVKSAQGDGMREVRSQTEQFVTWLREAESEEDEESDDD